MKSIKKKGFTLVELLVTIALLGILGSIIAINMTSIYKKSQAQEKTRIESIIKSSCEAYLKIESKESIDGCLTTNKLIEADYLKKSSLPKDYLNSSVSIKDNQCTKVSLTNDSCKDDNIQDKKYYVYFYDGSQKLENLTKSGKYNNSIKLPTYEKNGYEFEGWSLTKNSTEASYKANQIYNIKTRNNFYAVLKTKKYTITYVTNSNDQIDSQTYEYNQTIKLPTPNRENYNFAGWYLDKDLTKAVDFTTMPAKNITLYAKYTSQPIYLNIHGTIADEIIVNNQSYNIAEEGLSIKVDNNSLNNIKLHIKNNLQKYIDKIDFHEDSNNLVISNKTIDNEYINISLKNISTTINLVPYLPLDIYYPKSEEIASLYSISTANSKYCFKDLKQCYSYNSDKVLKSKTINNTTYIGKRVEIYDANKAGITVEFKIRKGSYLSTSKQFGSNYNFSEISFVDLNINNIIEYGLEANIGYYYKFVIAGDSIFPWLESSQISSYQCDSTYNRCELPYLFDDYFTNPEYNSYIVKGGTAYFTYSKTGTSYNKKTYEGAAILGHVYDPDKFYLEFPYEYRISYGAGSSSEEDYLEDYVIVMFKNSKKVDDSNPAWNHDSGDLQYSGFNVKLNGQDTNNSYYKLELNTTVIGGSDNSSSCDVCKPDYIVTDPNNGDTGQS